jgi:hypothetical protein
LSSLSAQAFREQWEATDDRVVHFSPEALRGIPIPPESAQFLIEAGLPHSAAPFLNFESPSSGPLPSVRAVWQLSEAFSHLWYLGSNGSGDPVCIAEDGSISYLNHDLDFEAVFMSSSVPKLASALLLYREAVHLTLARGPEDGVLGGVPEDVQTWFREALLATDPPAAEPTAMWLSELAS